MRVLFLLLIVYVLIGCDADNNQELETDVIASSFLDEDKNNIRDDIDVYIESLEVSSDPKVKSILQVIAVDLQYSVDGKNNPKDRTGSRLIDAIGCAYQLAGLNNKIKKVMEEITGKTANTEERIKRYLTSVKKKNTGGAKQFGKDDLCKTFL